MDKVRAVILAGGEGSRLGVLTAKRTKPAVPIAGKYRIIDFTLSNCVNSGIFDVMILAQYRPHSLIEHIGAGAPWDLNRDFTGGVNILTPYKARGASDWYLGTADAVQQNFLFIKRGPPDLVLILSGDHIYRMDYNALIQYHRQKEADLTVCAIHVPMEEASRFGILELDENQRITSFLEKPQRPPSNLANMGVYLFNTDVLNNCLWEDHARSDSSHDFGKDILPRLISEEKNVFAYPFGEYWVDVGTVYSYWQAHIDLLKSPPPLDLNDRSWVIHTRTAERPPVRIADGAQIKDSLISDGAWIASGALVEQSVLSPGVTIESGAVVRQSILLSDCVVRSNACIEASIIDKRVVVGENAHIGTLPLGDPPRLPMIGKNSVIPNGMRILPGAIIGPDVVESDFKGASVVQEDQIVETQRKPIDI